MSAVHMWVPHGKKVEVRGFWIESGLIYVGRRLPSVSAYAGPEPALIDPSLPVSRSPDESRDSRYYHYARSYHDMTPSQRGGYLRWLEGGRKNPSAPVMYLNVFLYGLERRLLFEIPPTEEGEVERQLIMAELRRLLDLHNHEAYWVRAARELVETVSLMTDEAPSYEGPVPSADKWRFPARLQVALGQLAVDAKPVPAEWALTWWKAHPECRSPVQATRCPEEFNRLFTLRYQERFGSGIRIRPGKRSLKSRYYPASPGITGGIELQWRHLPDVGAYTGPARRLDEVSGICAAELSAYSRLIGRAPSRRGTLSALTVLPEVLVSDDEPSVLVELRQWMAERLGKEERVLLDAEEMLARWAEIAPEKLTRSESIAYLELLERLGYGLEPDVRFGGMPMKAGPAVLFRLSRGGPSRVTPTYNTILATLHLALAVCAASGEISDVETRYLSGHLVAALHGSRAEQQRLEAHLLWRWSTGAKASGLKAKAALLPPAARPQVGRFLVSVAAADGGVSPEEVKALSKLYKLLELPPNDLFSDIHAHSVTPREQPVTVRHGVPVRPGFAIPSEPAQGGTARDLVLDSSKVEAKLADSSTVSALLGRIFTEEEPVPAISPSMPASSSREAEGELVAGLDAPHSALLRELAGKDSWERVEFERLAREHGLLPDGALDTLNEAVLEASDEPLCEGDDPIEMNVDVLKEMLA